MTELYVIAGYWDAGYAENESQVVAGGTDEGGKKRKGKRYVVEVDGKLVAFSSRAEAISAIKEPEAAQEEVQKPAEAPAKPLFSVSLEDVRQLAAERQALERFQAQLEAMRYEALLRMYEEMLDEQDIEDLLMIL